jgi:hypothetical protein
MTENDFGWDEAKHNGRFEALCTLHEGMTNELFLIVDGDHLAKILPPHLHTHQGRKSIR